MTAGVLKRDPNTYQKKKKKKGGGYKDRYLLPQIL